jgi:methylenetetrahydromethanopterin dehydrogenase
VADIDVKGCFIEKDPEKYIPLVASAHEMMRIAAILADQAREIEKDNNSVYRNPHARDGKILSKTELMAKPE